MPRLVIQKGEGVGKDHALGGECVVGRHASASFTLDDGLVSRRHFRVFPEGGGWTLEDLGSTNGTLVNGRKVGRVALADGDVISAGNTEMIFRQKDLLAVAGGPPTRTASNPKQVVPVLPPAPALSRVEVRPPTPTTLPESPVPTAVAPPPATVVPKPASPPVVAKPPAPPAAKPAAAPVPKPAAAPVPRPTPPPAPTPAPSPKKFEAPVPRKKRPT